MPAGVPSSTFQRVDPLNVREVFADSLGQSIFDGQTLRMEFCVVRMDNIGVSGTAEEKPNGKRHVVARLVLNSEGAIELVNQCMQFAAVMEQRGLIKRHPPSAPAPTTAMQTSS
jgi:hypothetical protein